MTGYNATTLPRAAALYGPQRIECRALQELGTLLSHAGLMQAYLAELLRGEPVNKEALGMRIGYTKIAAVDLYVALNLLEEVLGAHPIASTLSADGSLRKPYAGAGTTSQKGGRRPAFPG